MSKAVLIFSITFLSCFSEALSQQKLFLAIGGQGTIGNGGYAFDNHGDILSKGWRYQTGGPVSHFSYHATFSAYYRVSPSFSIEAGYIHKRIASIVHDQRFQKTYTGKYADSGLNGPAAAAAGDFDFSRTYNAPYLSCYYFPGRHKKDVQFYINSGVEFNKTPNTLFLTRTTMEEGDQSLTLNTSFQQKYISTFIELGIFYQNSLGNYDDQKRKKRSLSLGLRYSYSGNILNSNYQNVTSGATAYTDRFTMSGRFVMLTFKIGVPVWTDRSRHKAMKIKEKKDRDNTLGNW